MITRGLVNPVQRRAKDADYALSINTANLEIMPKVSHCICKWYFATNVSYFFFERKMGGLSRRYTVLKALSGKNISGPAIKSVAV